MATAMAMGNSEGNGNRDGDSDGNGDANGKGDSDDDSNCNSYGDSNNDKERVASSFAGDVQCCGRGNTLPPSPWTQRSVHLPALHHGVTLQRVFAPFQGGGFLTAHHGLCFFL
jgi:hypothetical protein